MRFEKNRHGGGLCAQRPGYILPFHTFCSYASFHTPLSIRLFHLHHDQGYDHGQGVLELPSKPRCCGIGYDISMTRIASQQVSKQQTANIFVNVVLPIGPCYSFVEEHGLLFPCVDNPQTSLGSTTRRLSRKHNPQTVPAGVRRSRADLVHLASVGKHEPVPIGNRSNRQ